MEEVSNFLPLNRRIFRNNLWLEDRTFSKFEAWLDLLQSARFENTEAKKIMGNKIVKWNRGQLIASLRYLSSRWNWSTKKVTAFLELLKTERMIEKETQKETGQSLITICKYDNYNILIESRKQQKKQEGNTKETLRKQEGNKTNKDNKENILIAEIEFDVFWEAYGKKVGNKIDCEKKWNKLPLDVRKRIIDILPAWKAQFSDKQYQPYAETFLNQQRWNDEIQVKKTNYSSLDIPLN